jgi:hypothetical protein
MELLAVLAESLADDEYTVEGARFDRHDDSRDDKDQYNRGVCNTTQHTHVVAAATLHTHA